MWLIGRILVCDRAIAEQWWRFAGRMARLRWAVAPDLAPRSDIIRPSGGCCTQQPHNCGVKQTSS